MKKIFVILLAVCWVSAPAMAQMKIGYFDLTYVMPLLPEVKKAETDIEAYAKQLDAEFARMQKEFNDKYKALADAANSPDGLSQTILAAKQEELQTLQKRLQEFEQRSVGDIQTRRDKALDPIYKKIETAVTEVATANAYTHVMRAESCYLPVKESNISDLVLKKLGITPPPPAEKK
ncbi:MAG: OmpH family outer membrane protein [Bacteroidetes bacterium]|nr:MAG: OmpH family outer membrane protein [Bacteroidota bacterium]